MCLRELLHHEETLQLSFLFPQLQPLEIDMLPDIPNRLTTRSLCYRIEHMYERERFSVSQHGRAGRGQAGDREERMTRSHVFLALSSYRLDGRSIREGNPVDRMPGPYADEHTCEGGGAFAGPTGARSSPCALAGMTW